MRYDSLPPLPGSISACNVLQRMIDGLGFRYQTATQELPEEFYEFKTCDSAMSGGQLLKHIYQLVFWISSGFGIENNYDKTLDSVQGYRDATLMLTEKLALHFESLSDDDLNAVSLYHKRTDKNFPIWHVIHGPIADAISHIGQINSWRRIMGNPYPGISPFTGV